MKKTSLLLLAGVACLFAACNKDKDNNGGGNNSSSIVGKWQFEKQVVNYKSVNGQTNTYIHTIDSMEECQRDNFIHFLSNGKYSYETGTTPCPWDTTAAESGSYALIDNNSKLVIWNSQDRDTTTIKSLNSTTLILTNTYTYNSTDSNTLSYTTNSESQYKRLP